LNIDFGNIGASSGSKDAYSRMLSTSTDGSGSNGLFFIPRRHAEKLKARSGSGSKLSDANIQKATILLMVEMAFTILLMKFDRNAESTI
jgi:hypothetical protein